MASHVCPYWVGHLLASPLRRWAQDPKRWLEPLVAPGMTVLDVGCAMGYFSLPLARMVGPDGRVICVDVQERMLRGLEKRSQKAALRERIRTRACSEESLGLADLDAQIDFALAAFVVHETPEPARLFGEIRRALKPGARLLFAEPKGHVSAQAFAASLAAATAQGFVAQAAPSLRRARTALLQRPSNA